MVTTWTILFLALCHLSQTTNVPTLKLKDGKVVQAIAFGTAYTPGDPDEPDTIRKATKMAIEYGFRLIDTAALYKTEVPVGEGIADAIANGTVKREDLVVITKLWNDKHAPDQVIPALRESLERLKLDYVDIYLMHFPVAHTDDLVFEDIDYLDTYKAMEKAYEQGLTKSLGLSNFNSSQVDRIIANCKVKPVVNEIEVNPTLSQVPLVEHCQKNDIVVIGFTPFGYMVPKPNAANPPPRFNDPEFVAMAQKYGKSTFQLALRYQVQRGIIPIAKTIYEDQMKQNMEIFDFKLSDEDMKKMLSYNKDIRVYPANEYKPSPYYPYIPY